MFYTDPDPGIFSNTDPDPGEKKPDFSKALQKFVGKLSFLNLNST